MLGGVCWLRVIIEMREWEQSGWLRFCVLYPSNVSGACERKEVRTMSNRRVEAIHLVILSSLFQGESEKLTSGAEMSLKTLRRLTSGSLI